MSLIGVSMLEMRQMIEQACLPDRCEVSCTDGEHLTIRLGQADDVLTVTDVAVANLNSCRDLVGLVAQLKAQRQAPAQPLKAIA
ncbi:MULTISPECIES: DUF1652 domain-containing protein [Pseudomonas]|uniref:DUF1652 domain-containing protein n=1 Tax=Pseudomonas fakonensis TaxID=2842355 RepID=A0ABX8N077_9PSED|nr:DUF1652 domain-containing protein [Pseudomonas fakonensis]QXH49375.1 DUF1652 domain-containing protein [Pseudomonas fakonensis]